MIGLSALLLEELCDCFLGLQSGFTGRKATTHAVDRASAQNANMLLDLVDVRRKKYEWRVRGRALHELSRVANDTLRTSVPSKPVVLWAPRAVRLTTGCRLDPDRSLAMFHVQNYNKSDDVAKVFDLSPARGRGLRRGADGHHDWRPTFLGALSPRLEA